VFCIKIANMMLWKDDKTPNKIALKKKTEEEGQTFRWRFFDGVGKQGCGKYVHAVWIEELQEL